MIHGGGADILFFNMYICRVFVFSFFLFALLLLSLLRFHPILSNMYKISSEFYRICIRFHQILSNMYKIPSKFIEYL